MTVTIVWTILWAIALAYSIKTAASREHGEARFATWFSNQSITLGILGTLIGFILLGYDWVSAEVPTTDELVKDLIICLVTSGEGWIAHAILEGVFTYKAPKEGEEMDLMVDGARRLKEELMGASAYATAIFNAAQQITTLPSLSAKFDELVASAQELEGVEKVLTSLTGALNELLKLNTAGNFIGGIATNLGQLGQVDSAGIGKVTNELGKLTNINLATLEQQGGILARFSDQAKTVVDNCQPLTGLPATLGQVKDAALGLNDGTTALEKFGTTAQGLPQQLQTIQTGALPILGQLKEALATVNQHGNVRIGVDVNQATGQIEALIELLKQVPTQAVQVDTSGAVQNLDQLNQTLRETLTALQQAQQADGTSKQNW